MAKLPLILIGVVTLASGMTVAIGPQPEVTGFPTAEPVVQDVARAAASSAGKSVVYRDSNDRMVAMRPCPGTPQRAPDDTHCAPFDFLPNGTYVTMRCWQDTAKPDGYPSPRWFYVTQEENGWHPGWTGWVYSDLVKAQTSTPNCTPDILAAHPTPQHPGPPTNIEIRGTCTSAGGSLSAVSSGFTPGGPFTLSISWNPVEEEVFQGKVDARGGVPWTWSCADRDSGDYDLRAVDEASGRWAWSKFRVNTPPPSVPSPRSVPSPTEPSPATAAPTLSTHVPPTSTGIPLLVSRDVVTDNRVTNGPTQMREDSPAYLSTQTLARCRSLGCAIPGTEFGSGRTLRAVCQVIGAELTNGDRTEPSDDNNPGLFTSNRWYRIQWNASTSGYLSEVWLRSSDRGGAGLPMC
ncbi:hypothetical protein SK854_45875 [Lentzea sp. BCCO 10_0061]|uniref:Ig-like domain-containing protein n=1 Tax=Lentzea sokolovensis TaxID=3095429 RepID=A0ABU4VDK4_9PSEU|nr:hypothetical protein [Lentzea sp. BCCO 10_0061]MDX8149520.1 hypothetical protein [Lentzea sp. BCCO 10_0061]